ncbi:MAG: TIM barrel protein, partial [Anaerolineae bacterium]|nr:TIM barrel protein [Anaerolineae bacterium]
MKIGVFPAFGDDLGRNVAFARDVGADVAALRVPPDVPPDALRAFKGRYAIEGIDADVVMAPRITTEAMIDAHLREREIAALRGLIAAMGEAGCSLLHLYVSSVRAPSEAPEREAFFARLIDYYQRIVEQAEDAGVVLATHTFHAASRLVWNYETFQRLLEAVPSPANGVLFCTGKTHYAGDDLVETIRRFGDRIALVHIRNVA